LGSGNVQAVYHDTKIDVVEVTDKWWQRRPV